MVSIDESASGDVWMMNPMPFRLTQFDTLGNRLSEFTYQPFWLASDGRFSPTLQHTDSTNGGISFVQEIPARPVTQVWQARVNAETQTAILLGGKPKSGWEKRESPYQFFWNRPAGESLPQISFGARGCAVQSVQRLV